MRYFKLKNPFRNVKLMLREIDNYYYFIRQLEILKDSGELKHYVLKINDKHCMYGAINLPPELLLYHKGDDLEQLEKTFFGNEMMKLNEMFTKCDIMELYKIEFERVKNDDYYAYVFNIKYKWHYCNLSSIFRASLSALAIAAGLAYLVFEIIEKFKAHEQ